LTAAVHNGARPPSWVGVIILAEKWGATPWEITGEEVTNMTRRRWYARGIMYHAQINARDAARAREIGAQYGR